MRPTRVFQLARLKLRRPLSKLAYMWNECRGKNVSPNQADWENEGIHTFYLLSISVIESNGVFTASRALLTASSSGAS